MGAVLQQSQSNGEWRPICFASRFLTDFEAKYSITKLELLAIVWAVEYFINYVYGVPFKILSDHKALMTVLRPIRGNKTFSSKLTRWVDRLLPFKFEVVHVPGRTLGMADYLSRHPTELHGATIKAETLWNEWFTVNSVISLNNNLENNGATSEQGERVKSATENHSVNRNNAASESEPIRKRDARNSREASKKHCSQIERVSKMSPSPSIKLLNEKMLPANHAADKLIQRVIVLVINYNKTGISRLPSPWREQFQSFSIDSRDFLYMDNRLVIPQSLRPMIMCSLHYGHPGRDSMLSMSSDIWWPRIHREIVDQARLCDQCLQSGKNLKCMLRQKQVGKIPEASEQNEEIALDFAGPFQNAKKGKKYLLVSIDHYSRWPEAKFLHRPTTKKVLEFLKHYIAQYGVPRKIRTDPGTVFVSEAFAQFCKKFGIQHVKCPIRDHRGNGKIERLMRTINERLRANKQIVLSKDKSRLSEILYSLRVSKKKEGKSPFEKHMGKEPNTVKSIVVKSLMDISEQDPQLELNASDFQDELDSTVLVRERSRGSKLEQSFSKKTGKVIQETAHTITIVPETSGAPKTLSKRDVAVATTEQKQKLPKSGRKRATIVESSTSSSETEESLKKKPQKKKSKQAPEQIAFDFEENHAPHL